jgi:predicted secreted protein
MNNQSFNYGTLRVTVAQEFQIKLNSTPSTGYIWEVSELPGGIQLLGSFVDQQQRESIVGGSATQVFRFIAIAPGESGITFSLRRSWESDAAQTQIILVKAQKS